MKFTGNRLYFGTPLIFVALFAVVYQDYAHREARARELAAAIEETAKAEVRARLEAERVRALEEERKQREALRLEREAERERLAARAEWREEMTARRDAARTAVAGLRVESERLKRAIDGTSQHLKFVEQERRRAEQEREFLAAYLEEARRNADVLTALGDRIEEIRAAAERLPQR